MLISPTNSGSSPVQTTGESSTVKSANNDIRIFEQTPISNTLKGGVDSAPSTQLASAISTVNKFIEPVAKNLEFSIDKETNKVIVKLVDAETNEILRQFPTDQMLAIAKTLGKLQGLLFELKA